MTPRYVITPGAPFPKRWRCADGEGLRVMCEPCEGYVLARRPRAMPFAISVKDLMNADRLPHRLGPFECLEKDERK